MTYDELLNLMTPSINKLLKKYTWLSTEYEDLRQEAYILLFEKMEKLNSIPEDKQKIAYFKVAFEGKLKDINIKEHKNMLRNSITSFKDDDDQDTDIFDAIQKSDIEYQYVDEFLEHITAVKRECDRKWRENNRERYREIARNYYHKKGKEKRQDPDIKEYLKLYNYLWRKKNEKHVKEYVKNYYQDHKEEYADYNRKYYQDHKKERLEYRKKYYEEHREEILEQKRQKRLERKNKNNE